MGNSHVRSRKCPIINGHRMATLILTNNLEIKSNSLINKYQTQIRCKIRTLWPAYNRSLINMVNCRFIRVGKEQSRNIHYPVVTRVRLSILRLELLYPMVVLFLRRWSMEVIALTTTCHEALLCQCQMAANILITANKHQPTPKWLRYQCHHRIASAKKREPMDRERAPHNRASPTRLPRVLFRNGAHRRTFLQSHRHRRHLAYLMCSTPSR